MEIDLIKQVEEELARLKSEHNQLSLEISDLTLERLSLESQKWAGNTLEQAADIREKIWTIDDALPILEEQRSDVEDRIKSLLRLLHQARRIEDDLAEGGLYSREIRAADRHLTDWVGRRENALLHLKEVERQIAVIAQAGAAHNGQLEE